MMAPLLLGAGFGLGVWALLRGLYPPRPSLAQVLATLHRTPAPAPILTRAAGTAGWTARVGAPFTGPLRALGLPTGSARRDLAVLGRPVEQHLAEKAAAALAGLLLSPAAVFALALGGVHLPATVPVWATLLLGVAGFCAPDLGVRAQANRRRVDFRHALSGFLDLVVIALAGGAGVEQALGEAAGVGSGWGYTQLRHALDAARLGRETPWATLGRLGTELGVPELVELAASVSLAGTEGAKIRASLAAKAAALRTHQLTDAEAAAQATTERMSLPVVVLFAGFLVFIGYPALAHVLGGL